MKFPTIEMVVLQMTDFFLHPLIIAEAIHNSAILEVLSSRGAAVLREAQAREGLERFEAV